MAKPFFVDIKYYLLYKYSYWIIGGTNLSIMKNLLLVILAVGIVVVPQSAITVYRETGDIYWPALMLVIEIFFISRFFTVLRYGRGKVTVVAQKVITRRFAVVDVHGHGQQEVEIPAGMAMAEGDYIDLHSLTNCGGTFFGMVPIKRGNIKDRR